MKNNKTLIDYAMLTRKSADLVTVLSEAEVCLEFVHATLAGDERMMLELLDKQGCDPYTMDISHHEPDTDMLQPRSLRDTALAMGHTHVLHLLPDSCDHTGDMTHYTASPDTSRDVIDDYDQAVSEYSDTTLTGTDVIPASQLARDINKVHISENHVELCDYKTAVQERFTSQQRPQTTTPKPLPEVKIKKPRRSYKKRASHVTSDEGYISTVSSIRSVSTSNSDADAIASSMTEGRYRIHDTSYYYTSAPTHDVTSHNNATSLVTQQAADSDTNKQPNRQPRREKASSVKSRPNKQRAQIYWQDIPSDEQIVPLPKPRKAKRSMSIRISRKYDADDPDGKSRMCVIS